MSEDKKNRVWPAVLTGLKIVGGGLLTALLIGVVCSFVFAGILGDYLQRDILPLAGMEIEDVEIDKNSVMYYLDENGDIQVYQQIFTTTSNKWAELEDIPRDLINAAVAIEDHRFYTHQGVDWVTTIKACARMFFGDDSMGGSSITQQLIKNLLLFEDETADDVTVQRKVLEIFRALQLEKRYHKDTIMEMYLNCIYLGQGCRGVRSAAETYFGKELELLTAAECASLIGITNSPTYYDPYQNFENNKSRKEDVLWAMHSHGWLTDGEYAEAVAQPITLKYGVSPEDRLVTCDNPECGYRGTVKTFTTTDNETHNCPVCKYATALQKDNSQDVYSYFADTVLEDVAKAMAKESGLQWNDATRTMIMQHIQKAGYHIYSTIDMKVQEQVDRIYNDLTQIPATRGGQQLQSGMVIIDNRTGDIVAMAGGVGGQKEHDGWNYATDAVRQSGSAIKPLTVYAPAFQSGVITPATVIADLPLTYNGGAYPLNDSRTYSYARTIYRGVIRSVNAVAARTLEKSGINNGFQYATEKFRLSTLKAEYVSPSGAIHSDIGIGPLAMGAQTLGVTVRDMSSAFATFANAGVYREGRTFTKVLDSNGDTVLKNTQDSQQILSRKTVEYMNYCLTAATREGTGYEANLSGSYGITTAGKTGTSGGSKDRWYCGYTGYYTAAVWCGFDDPEEIVCLDVANPAAVLFKKVMGPLHRNKSNIALYNSKQMVSVTMCLMSGKLATDACNHDIRLTSPIVPEDFGTTSTAMVFPEDMPTAYCNQHVMMDCCSGGGVATEWCYRFVSEDADVSVTPHSLVKLTQKQIDEILRAEPYRLWKDYLRNDYVYLTDGVFTGLWNDLQQPDAPYKTCPIHTQQAWEEYLSNKPTLPEEPTVPEESTAPEEPTLPETVD